MIMPKRGKLGDIDVLAYYAGGASIGVFQHDGTLAIFGAVRGCIGHKL
jgi:hypothetical protein